MGLDTLQGHRDLAKMKWWYKLATVSSDKYPKKFLDHIWNFKLYRGRQRKSWSKVVEDLFSVLGLDKAEWLEDNQTGDWSLKGFLSVIGESVEDRESTKFKKGLDSKVKLSLYATFNKAIKFKKYLRGPSDAGSRLMFKFRSGTHRLNEELGRHRGREGERSFSYVRKTV